MSTSGRSPLDADARERLDELFAACGRIARKHFQGAADELHVEDKGSRGGYDPVTEADTGVEALLRAGITAMCKDDRIVGEENGASGPEDAARTWYLDPIDGTKAFLTGMTGWGILVGLVEDGRAVAGFVEQPVLGESFSGVDGRATLVRRRGAPEDGPEQVELRTSPCRRLEDAILYTTHPSMFGEGEERARYDELGRRVRLQRFGGDCYAYCMLAAGRIDLVVESRLNAYDIVALIPLVEAAGGVITGPDGRPPLEGGTVVAAATPELAEQAWEVLRGGPAAD